MTACAASLMAWHGYEAPYHAVKMTAVVYGRTQARQDQITCHVHALRNDHASAISMHPSFTLIPLALSPTPHLPPSLLNDWHFSSTRTGLPPHGTSILTAEDLWIAQHHQLTSGAHASSKRPLLHIARILTAPCKLSLG